MHFSKSKSTLDSLASVGAPVYVKERYFAHMKWAVKSHKRILSHLTLTSVFIIVLNLVASSGNAKVSTPLLEYLKMKRSSRGRPISAVSSDWKSKVWNYLHLPLHHNGFPLHRIWTARDHSSKKMDKRHKHGKIEGLGGWYKKWKVPNPVFWFPFKKLALLRRET